MRLGQWVYWIETERPPHGPATVTIRHGQFFGRDRDTIAVQVCKGTDPPELVALSTLTFEGKSEAEIFAMGMTVRLVNNFNYPAASAITPDGKTLYTHKPPAAT